MKFYSNFVEILFSQIFYFDVEIEFRFRFHFGFDGDCLLSTNFNSNFVEVGISI
jgi:hypothetical protein